MFKKNWTKEEINLLQNMLKQNYSYFDIAKKLDRTYDSLCAKIKSLKTYNNNQIVNMNNNVNLDEHKLYEYIYYAIQNSIKKYHFIKKPKYIYNNQKNNKQIEVANLVLSDIHTGTVNTYYDTTLKTEITTYNDNIRKSQMQILLHSIYQIHHLLSHTYYFSHLNIFLLGDIITNDRIFEGQHFSIDKCVGNQIWTIVFELADLINNLTSIFKNIYVYCVVGNHGRTTKDKEEEPVVNNFEYHLYRILQLLLQHNQNIKVVVPTTYFYSTNVFNHTFYFSHGDTIRGYTISYAERKAKELLINLPDGYNVYLIGHRHKAERVALSPKSELLVNGSWIKHDSYAFKLYGTSSKPIQYFFGTSKKRPISWLFQIDFEGV